MKWTKRTILRLLSLVVLLAGSGAAYQTIASASDQRTFPPPGRLVDVGGYRLHLDVMGEDRGGPTVILDSGSQSASFQWGWVQPRVADLAHVVAYDRPGTGWSDAPPGPTDARELADDLHDALEGVGAEGPYVVVGHSMGSLTARAFAARYPEEVAGAVLIDPRNLSLGEDFPEDFPDGTPSDPPLFLRAMSIAGYLGIMRFTDPLGEYADQMPRAQAAEATAYSASNKLFGGMWEDVLLAESAVPDIREGHYLEGKPVVVVSAGKEDGSFSGDKRARFTETHSEMAESLSPNGEHRIVGGADHLSIVTNQRHAEAVSGAVEDVVEQGRTEQ
ncbi:MAG TPA: alpha/beta hydrolase [Rubrobacter sp.]|nr:alpha/beta hydrolase [Rubrobacter sp.]